ncbi:glycine--tRNA ligase subunit beta [Thorsellia anophelis]|nr:glycine--tRNA ligase subunit beta [Thorsellia anophelis]
MNQHATLLIELGTEELPPKALKTLATAFSENFKIMLDDAEINHEQVTWYASPRRLALLVDKISKAQGDREIEKKGPAISQAYDQDGNPSKAALGWAKGCGIDIKDAKIVKTDKGEWLIHKATVKGAKTSDLIPDMVTKALNSLPIPKLMRWGNSDTQFVRPVHTLTMLLDDEIISGEVLGLSSNRVIRGHRFMGASEFELKHANDYERELLEKGSVLVDYEKRKNLIEQEVKKAADALGGIADISNSLLEEVTSLVEWPVILTAKFEEKFLAVPAEALVHTMKGDQKYFPVYHKESKELLPNFIFVTNIESKDPSQIIEGNEKVVRPRLSDAEFFFNTDRKQKLIDRLPRLSTVLFQQQLGSLKDKSERIAILSKTIAEKIGADPELAYRAGLLSKCDLLTNMVFEFTETQGVMGMHYARFDGENEEVAIAIKEQYQPRFAGDDLPKTLIASSVAIAEKMDTLAGIFGIGQHPKGDKDPFALRRASLGILRIIVEKELPLDLSILSQQAIDLYGDKLTNKKAKDEIIEFMLGRFRSWYQDAGYAIDTIQSVLARKPTAPVDFDKRVKAVTYFRSLDAANALAAANKRVSNILAKSEVDLSEGPQAALYQSMQETRLATHLVVIKDELIPLFEKNDYQLALEKLAELRENVDDFFDNVLVMDENIDIKTNRLRLLNQLRELFLKIADISLLQ